MEQDDKFTNWLYKTILDYVKSPNFREPIKSFVDENCSTFNGTDENKHEQHDLHLLFKKKVESLLEKLISELNIEQSSFLEAMEIGINSPEKRYFMQLIACDNYDYFKSMMTKRNLQLEESAYKMMYDEFKKTNPGKEMPSDPDFVKFMMSKKEADKQLDTQIETAVKEEATKIKTKGSVSIAGKQVGAKKPSKLKTKFTSVKEEAQRTKAKKDSLKAKEEKEKELQRKKEEKAEKERKAKEEKAEKEKKAKEEKEKELQRKKEEKAEKEKKAKEEKVIREKEEKERLEREMEERKEREKLDAEEKAQKELQDAEIKKIYDDKIQNKQKKMLEFKEKIKQFKKEKRTLKLSTLKK